MAVLSEHARTNWSQRGAERLRRARPKTDLGQLAYLVNCLLDEFHGAAGAEFIDLNTELRPLRRPSSDGLAALRIRANRLDVPSFERGRPTARHYLACLCALVHRLCDRAAAGLGGWHTNGGYRHVYAALFSDQRELMQFYDLPRLLPMPMRVGLEGQHALDAPV